MGESACAGTGSCSELGGIGLTSTLFRLLTVDHLSGAKAEFNCLAGDKAGFNYLAGAKHDLTI